MNPTLKAILARYGGDVNKAIVYCEYMAYSHPRLAVEYRMYREALLEESCASYASK